MNSQRFSMLPILAALVAILVSFAPGCSSKDDGKPNPSEGGSGGSEVPPTPCESDGDCEPADRCDLEAQICVPKCTADNQCPKDTGTYCDLDTGICIPGEPCEGDFTCGNDWDFDYCKDPLDCVCSPDASVAEGGTSAIGVCWRVAKSCEPCSESFECGNSSIFGNNKADCKRFTVGSEMEGVCLPRLGGKCPAGMVPMDDERYPGLAEYCMPQGGDCGNMVVCREDNDCVEPGLPICDPVRQICIPGCSFDFERGESVGCAPGRVCHATAAGTDPTLLNDCATAPSFGVGSCDAPCTDNDQCEKYGAGYECVADGGTGSAKRCRPTGCLDDSECTGGQGHFLGYCDVNDGKCKYDSCRAGLDPRRGCGSSKLYEDCSVTHKCVEGNDVIGIGTCEEKDCIDQNGAQVGCLMGNFCAGETFLDPLTGKNLERIVEGPPGTSIGECFPMDLTQWCSTTCSLGEGGRPVLGGECNVRQANPVAGSPALCDDKGVGATCFWGCEFQEECPSAWSCSSKNLEARCEGYQICKSDSECGPGNRCVEPLVNGQKAHFGEMEPFKVCECSGTDSCGAGYSCNAGITTAERRPTEPDYLKVKERYCAKNDECGGASGSCEWLGATAIDREAEETVPVFMCAVTRDGMTNGPKASCPSPSRPGKTWADLYTCVYSSVCQPGYSSLGEGQYECIVAKRDPLTP